MDPADLPLIEIAGEDDSLLITNDAVSTAADAAYFLCSPLQPPRSGPGESVKLNVDSQKARSSFCGDSTGKENSNANTIEEKKFSLPPQKMMKKKKGGGFNLRKSIAWNRAFFTDEGVLNSEELSMITESISSSGSLSVVHEETSSTSGFTNLQEIEENLFKVTPRKDRTVGGSPLPKHASPARYDEVPSSAVRRKGLSARDTNRSGSKRSGCPRPLASSSSKRPANGSTVKSATKEIKVSKIPVPKPVPCALSKTSKSVTVGGNDSKQNRTAHPPVNLNNTTTGLNNAKVGPTGKSMPAKSRTQQARRNMASLVKSSSTKASHPSVTEANNGLKVMSKRALPSNTHTSQGRDDRPRKPAVSAKVISKQGIPFADHASYNRDDRSRETADAPSHTSVNSVHTQLQTSRPSGLRMPSPSLGFFNQAKTSLPGPQPRRVPNMGHVNLRPTSSVGKMQNVCNDEIVRANIDVQISRLSSAEKPATIDKVDSVLQKRDMQVELKVPSDIKGYAMTGDQRKVNNIPVQVDEISKSLAEPNIAADISLMEDVKFQSNDTSLMQHGSSLVVPEERKDIQSHSSMKVADPNENVQNSLIVEYKISEPMSDSRCEDGSTSETLNRNSHVEDSLMMVVGGKLTDEVNDATDLSTSAPDAGPLANIGTGSEKPGHQNIPGLSCIGEQVFQDDRIYLNHCVSDGFIVFPEESQQNTGLRSIESKKPEGNDACRSEAENSRGLYPTPPAMLDLRSNEVEMVDFLFMENIASISEDNKSVECILDTQFTNDIDFHGQSYLESLNMDPDQTRVPLTAPDNTTAMKRGDLTDQLNLTMQVEDACTTEDKSEHGYLGSKGSDLSGESSPHLQPTDDKIYLPEETLVQQINLMNGKTNFDEEEPNVLRGEIDVDKHNVEQVFVEYRIPNWNPEANSLLLEGSKYVEECTSANNVEISTKVKGHDGSQLRSPLDLSVPEPSEKETNKEADGVCGMNIDSVPGAPLEQFSVANFSERQHELDDTTAEDNNATKELEKSGSGSKRNDLVINPPSNAIPFSDEWLAAIEAAGEEILTKKGGAVQNSPPNKSEPQLGPYSPVKRKQNQVIGPFDCTKHINNPSGSQ